MTIINIFTLTVRWSTLDVKFWRLKSKFLGTLAFPSLNSWGRSLKKIITWEGVVCFTGTKHQGQGQTCFKYWKCTIFILFYQFLSCLVVQSSIEMDWWWHILGRVSFQHTFLGNLGNCWYWEGLYPHVWPYYTPCLEAQFNKQNYNFPLHTIFPFHVIQ